MKLGLKQGIQFHYLAPFSEKARKNKVYVCMYVFLDWKHWTGCERWKWADYMCGANNFLNLILRCHLLKQILSEINFFWSQKKVSCLKQGSKMNGFCLKVIPFNCIVHPFCASFFAWLARARARAPLELDRFSPKTEQFWEITGRFLLNELGDPIF